ncbi:DUF6881 domain-containing protein [Mucilaginibacter paludis]|uniref:DUF6881 domain-containing protein n=1 Tax=Mucilaginibacter paludis DSM 18603 TaxID=714943 RepID=H1Y7X7_9SPHI|nr:hypothetical protein [Mucilaginibacter paludis]EHQ30463.1 hypothetical protein Mucpa_6410 [Mucilaginibacter paludis DSM 18603]
MKYIKVQWIHNFEDEPDWWYHEIGEDGFETRKLMIYKNGTVEIVSKNMQTGDIELSDQEFLSVEEINQNPEFVGGEISAEEFQSIWNNYVQLS